MEIEFDQNKEATNLRVHGFSLTVGIAVLTNLIVQVEDDRRVYGERRMVAFGAVDGRLLCAVYTRRGNAVRMIPFGGRM